MAGVWFFALAGLGIWLPYYSLYLYENAGLDGEQIGLVLAMLPLAGLLGQPLWGQVADRAGSRARVLCAVAAGASLAYAALYAARSFEALLLGTALLALFSTALVPSSVAVTLALTHRHGPRAFGRIRVWGTVGFLVAVVGFERLLSAVQLRSGLAARPGGPSEPGLELMFPAIGALVALAALLALALPRGEALGLRAPRGDWRRLLRHAPFLRLLGFVLLAYLCLQGPMFLFPVFVRGRGGDMQAVSHMWVLMLLLEIPLIWASGTGLVRLGPRGLIALGVLAGGIRWTACAVADDMRWIYAAQLLHAVTVTGLIVGGPFYVDAVVPERLRSTGQNALAMFGFGLGGLGSQVSAGALLAGFGPDAPYLAGGVGALMLGLLVPLLLPPPQRPPEPGEPDSRSPASPRSAP